MYVFEDVDAQTNIVHQRTTIVKASDSDIIEIKSESIDDSTTSVYQSENKKNGDLDLSYLFNILDGTLSQQDMVYCMTTNHIERLDKGFYRKGRFHAIIELKKCDKYQIQCIFEKIMKREILDSILDKISEDVYTPAEVIHHLLENKYNVELSDQEIIDDLIKSHDEFIQYIQKTSQISGLFPHKINRG
jgi:SpoVK/Ycf46/Vps4 family AAA+-type ATPase